MGQNRRRGKGVKRRNGMCNDMGGQIFLPVWGIRTREKERGERQV